ncbi:hypothetical protein CBR_g46454 [Chara braunii]|uniref:Reverse transcriptase domain-containing protein n=1 Tax=Chara braunii TaxID=69332 RepID=A0A388M0S7_CHABU|nr:hypothetical protein CBR_g46454 [Chara braunii]|eukprot:GBG88083.1 hypothetical protein CBR_g46454 [Chara braunii]
MVVRRMRVVWVKNRSVGDVLFNFRSASRQLKLSCQCAEADEVFLRVKGHVCFRMAEVDFVPTALKNSRNIPSSSHVTSRRNLVRQVITSFGLSSLLPTLHEDAFDKGTIDCCFNKTVRRDGLFSWSIDTVLGWREKFGELVKCPIDHNAGDSLVCCPVIYQSGMNKLFLRNPGFVIREDEDEVICGCALRYKEGKFDRLGKWNRAGSLGQTCSIPKHKDITKWRPICPTHSECGVSASKKIARAINQLLWELPRETNFNLRSMADLVSSLREINGELKQGERFLGMAFDIKEMFCNLPHESILRAVRWVVDFWEIRGCKGVLIRRKGKGAKLQFGESAIGWSSVSFETIYAFVEFDLGCTLFKASGRVLQQRVGILMGKSSSPALACLLCSFNEFLFLSSLGSDRRLVGGVRMVDDVSIMARYKQGDCTSMRDAESILVEFESCYDSNLILERTSDADCWDFLGCILKTLEWPWGIQCVALHKNQQRYNEDGLRFQNLQDFDSFCSRQQKKAVIGSCLHRAKALTTMQGTEVAFLFTLKVELRKRNFPDAYFDDVLRNFSGKFGGIWADWVHCLTGWEQLSRLGTRRYPSRGVPHVRGRGAVEIS